LILEALIIISQQQRVEMLPNDWKALAFCESSLNPEALNPSGKYRGLFQFDIRSWEYVGGSGDPSRASVREQLKRAKMLKEKQGWSAWPQCAKKLGLL
jgi:resuscitation-promoting factor RpfB